MEERGSGGVDERLKYFKKKEQRPRRTIRIEFCGRTSDRQVKILEDQKRCITMWTNLRFQEWKKHFEDLGNDIALHVSESVGNGSVKGVAKIIVDNQDIYECVRLR